MEYNEFETEFNILSKQLEITLSEDEINKFYEYMKELLIWNEKMNLTAITNSNEIILKHFIDSLTITKYLNNCQTILDMGTGAGFPGLPLAIINKNLKFTLADSLNKRIMFLENVKEKLKLDNIELIHGRAEELGKNSENRESYDVAVSRAVARLNVLLEYLLPFIKIGGKCICMKAGNCKEEIKEAEKAMEILGGKIEKIEEFILPNSDINRTVIIIKKEKNTPPKYPRKPGTPAKEPII